jgi:hypothetical protein
MAFLDVGPGKDYADYPAAWAAGSDDDVLRTWLPFSHLALALTGKRISIISQLPPRQCCVKVDVNFVAYSGDFTSTALITVQGISIVAKDTAGVTGIQWDDSSYAGVDKLLVDGCDFIGCHIGFYVSKSGPLGPKVQNCLFVNCNTGFNGTGGYQSNCFGNTFFRCITGFTTYNNTVIKDCYALECDTPWGAGTCTGSNNASDTGTAPGTSPSTISRAQALVLCDLKGFDSQDPRPRPTSSLVAAGVAVTGMTLDINGQTRPNPPSIGCSEVPDFLESIPAASQLISNATSVYGVTTTATGVAEQHTDDEVLLSAFVPGNYDDSELTEDNVKKDIEFGLSSKGRYSASVLTTEQAAMLEDIHQFMGLDAAEPLDAADDGVSKKTLTVNGKTIIITNSGITRS